MHLFQNVGFFPNGGHLPHGGLHMMTAGGYSSHALPPSSPENNGGVGSEANRKRAVRLQKNREAARECRRKKKEYIKCLENRVAVLEVRILSPLQLQKTSLVCKPLLMVTWAKTAAQACRSGLQTDVFVITETGFSMIRH